MITIPLSLLAMHTFADFGLQTDWQAINKSKNWRALGTHVLVYSLCFLPWGLAFALVTFLTHFLTDAVTSRITSKLWFIPEISWTDRGEAVVGPKRGNRHWFFVMVGVDQLIHFTTLALTYKLLS